MFDIDVLLMSITLSSLSSLGPSLFFILALSWSSKRSPSRSINFSKTSSRSPARDSSISRATWRTSSSSPASSTRYPDRYWTMTSSVPGKLTRISSAISSDDMMHERAKDGSGLDKIHVRIRGFPFWEYNFFTSASRNRCNCSQTSERPHEQSPARLNSGIIYGTTIPICHG